MDAQARRARVAAGLAAMLALVIAAGQASAQDKDIVLRSEFPVDLAAPPSAAGFSGLVDPAYVARIPDGEASAALLDEARWTFSGMVWGFDYVYTPSDKARAIAELFDIRQRSPEASAAMELRAVSSRLVDTTLYAVVEFYPDGLARREMSSWASVSAANQGRGSAPIYGGVPRAGSAALSQVGARRDATTAAIREALRAYLRSVTHNKPREVRGVFALVAPPRIYMKGGSWVAAVRIYARVDEILSYGAY